MEIVIAVAIWLGIGAAGSALSVEFFWRRGSFPMDVDLTDVGFFSVMAILGPINLIIGFLFALGWLFRKALKSSGIDPQAKILKARR
ncbi:hypothetical protein [Rhizobium aethiopicum]|uniref:Uncharacterized protein n=1 Tax=Rhizobium aethiopicum TaxID=1138170 RepID=A0A7W6MHI1_9HYPH|nr:hypothetical protein [Rhizobium aethiopicum]MBB4192820.1 hypothetical protein [Rhizobium aethiopicum]